ncbi:hypothetical protein F6455_06805 [Proteobacteria bacterium 005FR1]|nr:hypothetical protein [Proteobacteria bacterium 005FR1]
MKFMTSLALSLMIAPASVWAADCQQPEAPTVPDGASASYDDMIAGQQAIKSFQADNKQYLDCMDKEIKAAVTEAKTAKTPEERSAAAERHTDMVNEFNAAISEEEQLAAKFNSEIQEYQAEQGN